MVVVDSGFSFTHVIGLTNPHVSGPSSCVIRRIDVGGKALTNYLKEMVSFRQLDLTGENYIVNQMKEHISYIATVSRSRTAPQ